MVYGVLRFINFAHSDVFMVGAFVGYYAIEKCHLPGGTAMGGLLVLGCAMAVCATLGVIIEKLAYRPLRERSTLSVLITAIGVSLLLQNLGQKVFGANPKAFPALFPAKQLHFGGLTISSNQLVVLAVTLGLL